MISKISNTPLTAPLAVGNDRHVSTPLYPIRYFFVVMSFLFLVISGIGFVPSYLAMHSEKLTVHWFVHVHGILMAGWLGIFLTQSILAARGNLQFHRKLGLFSVVLGILVWVSMGIVSFRALIGFPPRMADIPWNVLLLQLLAMNLFGIFLAWGIVVRKDAAAHKRLLFVATLVLLQAAIGRIQWLPTLGIGFPSEIFIYQDALLIPLFVYDLAALRRIHRITWIGSAYIVTAQLILTIIWGLPA